MRALSIPLDSVEAMTLDGFNEFDRKKLELLLHARLRNLLFRKPRPFPEVMDEIGKEAERRGLTPEILDDLLCND